MPKFTENQRPAIEFCLRQTANRFQLNLSSTLEMLEEFGEWKGISKFIQKKTTEESFNYFPSITRVLSQVHPDAKIDSEGLFWIDDFCGRVIQALMEAAEENVNEKEVKKCVRQVLNGELVLHALSEGNRACSQVKTGRNAMLNRGLVVDKERVESDMKAFSSAKITPKAVLFCSAVVEYVLAEVLEMGGRVAEDRFHEEGTKEEIMKMNLKDVYKAIQNDKEVLKLFEDLSIEIQKVEYLRKKGEKAKAWDESEGLLLSEMKHGDIVYDPNGYRGTKTLVVCQGGKGLTTEPSSDSAGYCEIPEKVTALIEDPLDFYSEVVDDKLEQGVTTICFPDRRTWSTDEGWH